MNYEIVPGPGQHPDDDGEGRNAREQFAWEHSAGEPFFAGPEVGEFRQGGTLADARLRQYLVLRVLGHSVERTLLGVAIAIIVGAALLWASHHQIIGVLVGLVGFGWLVVARLVSAILRRLSGAHRLGPDEARVNELVKQTRKGLRSELRRVGLPSGPWGEFRVGVRLVRPIARITTLRKLAGVKLESVIPRNRLDELHLLLRQRAR